MKIKWPEGRKGNEGRRARTGVVRTDDEEGNGDFRLEKFNLTDTNMKIQFSVFNKGTDQRQC